RPPDTPSASSSSRRRRPAAGERRMGQVTRHTKGGKLVKISRPAGGKPCEDLSSRGGKGSDHRQRTPATHPRDAADDAHQRRQEGDRRGLKRSVNSELPKVIPTTGP